MHRCFADSSNWSETRVILSQAESRHLLQVLRVDDGAPVDIFDGEGRIASGQLVKSGRTAEIEIESIRKIPALTPESVLIQAVPKGKKMDLIIEKATELGATEILPVITDRTVVDLKKEKADARLERWHRIAVSAAKQCGTAWIPRIAPVTDLGTALSAAGSLDILLVGTLETATKPVKEVLRAIAKPARVGCIVGPEGDLTAAEVEQCAASGASAISLGSLVLRTETAALCMLSIVNYEYR